MTQTTPFIVVVGFDLSELGELALERAIDTIQAHEDAQLHVLAVLDDRTGLLGVAEGKPTFAAAERVQIALRTIVDKKLLEIRSRPVNLFLHARIGSPAGEIVDLAEEAEADLVVVGTHGRHGVSRWVLGSVAERVVRYAHCPVLVARQPPEHKEPKTSRWSPEPPCEHCLEVRRASSGEDWWCPLHTKPHPLPHRYSYREAFPPDRSWVDQGRR